MVNFEHSSPHARFCWCFTMSSWLEVQTHSTDLYTNALDSTIPRLKVNMDRKSSANSYSREPFCCGRLVYLIIIKILHHMGWMMWEYIRFVSARCWLHVLTCTNSKHHTSFGGTFQLNLLQMHFNLTLILSHAMRGVWNVCVCRNKKKTKQTEKSSGSKSIKHRSLHTRPPFAVAFSSVCVQSVR